ncbi:hypothetical protein BDY21DRAFT_350399 [Lineolata rhizophorae]|uniref:Alpha/beta hydrolase fold-3 domain-containing protein n=1 Tax=Lineolata rhizophorae TaxID=578093 RepID=A0A6A6NU58_9PEZI|nr:hypothetical protein BDY21DRAFT_350399 [Lineolata rhizophorae]
MSETDTIAGLLFLTRLQKIDLRVSAPQKRKPPNFPSTDPFPFLHALVDSYAFPAKPASDTDPRCNPILADLDMLPENILMNIAAVDILLYEQLEFIEKLKRQLEADPERNRGRKVEAKVYDGQLHGWLELPSIAIDESTRQECWDLDVAFIKDIHRKYGFEWKEL